MTRTGWAILIGSAALYGIGWQLGYPSIVAIGAVGLITGVVGVALVMWPLAMGIDRTIHPDRVTAGDVALGMVTVRNRSARRSPALVATERIGPDRLQVALPRLPAKRSTTVTYRLPTSRRGVIDAGPFAVARTDPLGLVERDRAASDIHRLWVHPRRHPVRALPASLDRSLDGPTTDTAPRGSITFHTLREYVPGDELRHIHWRTSARVGTLMVKQHVDTSLPDLTIVLDARPGAHTEDSFEQAIEMAASVSQAALLQNFPLHFLTTSGVSIDTRLGGNNLQRFLDELALLKWSDVGDFSDVTAALAHRRRGFAILTVAGTADATDLEAIALTNRSFAHPVVVNTRRAECTIDVPGAWVIAVDTSEEFAGLWNSGRPR
jgi:uncharacterized protein (DUF58 family)